MLRGRPAYNTAVSNANIVLQMVVGDKGRWSTAFAAFFPRQGAFIVPSGRLGTQLLDASL